MVYLAVSLGTKL